MLSIFIPWHKTPLTPPPQNDHKSNLFPWHKSILCWRCFRDFMVVIIFLITIDQKKLSFGIFILL
jgi:hypothetical protein